MIGSYIRKDLKRPTNPAAGAAKSTKTKIHLLPIDDILKFPPRGVGGVRLEGNIVPLPGKTFSYIYETPSSQKDSYAAEGEDDAKGFKAKVEGTHPGNSVEVREFVQNNLNRDFVVLKGYCNQKGYEVYGTECSPMTFTGTYESGKDSNKTTLIFEQSRNSEFVPADYSGEIILKKPRKIIASSITVVEGDDLLSIQDTVTGDISFTDVNIEHGQVISLIGMGGDAPATLSETTTTTKAVYLKDGVTWAAEEDAVIHLKVFKTSDNVMLFEVSRQ